MGIALKKREKNGPILTSDRGFWYHQSMKPFLRNYGSIILSVIGAIAIIVTALLAKGTAYENAWLYIVCVQVALLPLWDTYVRRST